MSSLRSTLRAITFLFLSMLPLVAACGRSDLNSEDPIPGDDSGTFDAGDAGDASDTGSGCSTNADCPPGQTCDPNTHKCVVPGCQNCRPPTPFCRPDLMVCVACVMDSQCPMGEVCNNFQCVAHCGSGGACNGGLACCSSLCIDETSDPRNCGRCGNSCGPYAHSVATCAQSKCALGACEPGFSDCNHVVQDGCEVSTKSDPNNCGGCGNRCPTGETCSGGVCVGGCGAGGVCPPMQTCCGMSCANTQGDPNNCGGCGVVCGPVPNATTTCTAAKCTIASCSPGFGDCNHIETDGCEANLGNDNNNCGGCGVACIGGSMCVGGMCQPLGCNGGPACAPGQSCCTSGCSNTQTDTSNCGGCGNACAPGDTCVGGMCKPPLGCNGGPMCVPGQTCCMSGCSNTQTDTRNCGGCGNACAPGDTCVGGMCIPPTGCNGGPACGPGLTCCSSGCVNEQTDANNCGTCGNSCGGVVACTAGTCAMNEGMFDPTVSPTYLSPGVHLFTGIHVRPGIVVYVAGGGPFSGTLDLHSTGPIIIDGIIDVSGGPGTQNTITSRSTNQGRAGSGGYTGEPYQSAAGSSACEFVAGNPGLLGKAVGGSAGTCPIFSTTVCVNRNDPSALLFTSPVARYGGGAGVFTGYRAYGSGGGGPGGGAPGALGAAVSRDCSGVTGGGGAGNGSGGSGGGAPYDGANGALGQTQCAGLMPGVPPAYVGGGGGGSIGTAAVNDLAVLTTFQTGSGGGGGSADYYNRPVFGGTSGGGGGGGALRLATPSTITINGQLLANGGFGGDAFIGSGAPNCDPQPGAPGGGGSGGVVYLSAPIVTVSASATVSAAGGAGGVGSVFASTSDGGNGGLGRVRISATPGTCSLSGAFTPPLASGCSATPGGMPGFAYVGVYPN